MVRPRRIPKKTDNFWAIKLGGKRWDLESLPRSTPPGFKKRNFADEFLKKKELQKKQMEEIESFEVGDLVFAKTRGFEPWPARIEEVEDFETVPGGPKEYWYAVMFFGTHEVQRQKVELFSGIPSKDVHLYNDENIQKFGKPKKLKLKFEAAMLEIEKSCNVLASDPFNQPSVPGPSSGLARNRNDSQSTVLDDDSNGQRSEIPLDITISSPAPKRVKLNDDDTGSTKFTGKISIDETKLNLENEKCDNFLAVENLLLEKKKDDSQVGESSSVSDENCDEFLTASPGSDGVEMADVDKKPPSTVDANYAAINCEIEKFEDNPVLMEPSYGESPKISPEHFSTDDDVPSSTGEQVKGTIEAKLNAENDETENILAVNSSSLEPEDDSNDGEESSMNDTNEKFLRTSSSSVNELTSPVANQQVKIAMGDRKNLPWEKLWLDPNDTVHKRLCYIRKLIHYEVLLKMSCSKIFGSYNREKCISHLKSLAHDFEVVDDNAFNRENILCAPTLIICVNRIASESDDIETVKVARSIVSYVAVLFDDIQPLDLDSFLEMFKERSNEYLLANPHFDFYSRAKLLPSPSKGLRTTANENLI